MIILNAIGKLAGSRRGHLQLITRKLLIIIYINFFRSQIIEVWNNMEKNLISQVKLLNPWIATKQISYLEESEYLPRLHSELMLSPEWDDQQLGPRRAGKTTLGRYLATRLVSSNRFDQLLYLNCDLKAIREHLKDPLAVVELVNYFGIKKAVLFIDEVQRLENPGLLLKSIADLKLPIKTVKHYLGILEQTFVISSIKPFVGNKRSEVTSNPVYYFIDNGFRNYALDDFTPVLNRQNCGLLIENLIFQELLKYKLQNFLTYTIHYWRTTSGAEVDFVLKRGISELLPIEVKFKNLSTESITRSYRSFLQAYQPKMGIVINKNQVGVKEFEGCPIHFISIDQLEPLFTLLNDFAIS